MVKIVWDYFLFDWFYILNIYDEEINFFIFLCRNFNVYENWNKFLKVDIVG